MLKKGLSQHLLKDGNLLRKIVRLAGIGAHDTVVEIGAGYGDLTRVLAKAAGRVTAVEIDRDCMRSLEALGREVGNLTVVPGDFLSLSLTELAGSERIRVVGNIPYKITGPILAKILEERRVVRAAHLTVQKEIGERVTAGPGSRTYGALSVNCGLCAETKLHFLIRAAMFVPPPKVDSAFISLVMREEGPDLPDGLFPFVRQCFQGKRKLLKWSLRRNYGDRRTAALYGAMGFSETVRAEELEPPVFAAMYRFLEGEEGRTGSIGPGREEGRA